MIIEYETIAKALFINYESLYDINMETDSYLCFFQSESYEMFKLEKNGTNFFRELEKTIPKAVFLEDQEYHKDWQDTEHGTGDQYVVIISVRGQQGIKADGQGKFLRSL